MAERGQASVELVAALPALLLAALVALQLLAAGGCRGLTQAARDAHRGAECLSRARSRRPRQPLGARIRLNNELCPAPRVVCEQQRPEAADAVP